MTLTMLNIPLHPDDVLFFHDVKAAMQKVATRYKLPLRSVEPMTMPREGMADRLGECTFDGRIRLVLRCTDNGAFCPMPMSPQEVWDTAAHELAHLRHFHHGEAFNEFWQELKTALDNLQENHRDKVIKKLVKMQALRSGEAELGNTAAAETFAGMINKMMIEHELHPSDLDYARATDDDPVVEIPVDMPLYKIERKQVRVAWQESLARVVDRAHLCTNLISPGSNRIWFVGTRSHALVAEYAYGTLVPAAIRLGADAYREYRNQLRRDGKHSSEARGYYHSWLNGFVGRIAERFEESRKAAVAASPEGAGTGLMRLNGAMKKVDDYINDKFKKRSKASTLSTTRSFNRDGRNDGRAAADALAIHRRGMGAGTRGLLNK